MPTSVEVRENGGRWEFRNPESGVWNACQSEQDAKLIALVPHYVDEPVPESPTEEYVESAEKVADACARNGLGFASRTIRERSEDARRRLDW